jgi:ubiquinone biosynthesis protein
MNDGWKRAGHVVNTLLKHGMGYFVHELGLKWHLPFIKKLAPKGMPPLDLPVRMRKAMEELGGAYLKLGQFLALRPDLLPKEYCDEFKKLFDNVPQMPAEKVRHTIEASLKAPIKAFFTSIEAKPIGSASIAQVHKAKLRNGKPVVVKVQRPEARKQFDSDTKIMYYLAHKIERRFRDKAISPLTIVQEFERYTAQELNFVLEARTIDRFARHFKKSRTVVIPEVYWPATTRDLLTMDCIDGTKLTALLQKPGSHDLKTIAKNIADASFEQVLKLGVFHADLHPGNILVLPGNKIGLLDFGIVGTLNEELIRQTVAIYAGLVAKNTSSITKVLLKVGIPKTSADIEGLKLDVERIVNEWYGSALGKARVTEMMQALFESAVAHKITMPAGFILLGKALVTLEGTCLALDSGFNFVEYSQPKIQQLLKEQQKPKAVLKRFSTLSKQYAEVLAELPQQASEVLDRLKRGSIDLNISETDVKHLGMDLNRSSNRLSYALLIAALLVSSAMLVDLPPKIGQYSVFTLAGLIFASLLLGVLLVSVWREGISPYDLHKEPR